jgi:thioredoxin-like negative regulator of GroEL
MKYLIFSVLLISNLFLSSCDSQTRVGSDQITGASQTPADTSLDLLNSALVKDPRNTEILHQRAKLYISRKQFDEALKKLQEIERTLA